jgi:hypothetical protein
MNACIATLLACRNTPYYINIYICKILYTGMRERARAVYLHEGIQSSMGNASHTASMHHRYLQQVVMCTAHDTVCGDV